MKKITLALLLSVFPLVTSASSGHGPAMDAIETDIWDKESLQAGLTLYTNYCFGCHTLKYSRYERVADDLGIPHEIYEENLIPGKDKIGQLMTNSMALDQAKVWFGNPPPDLTLSARLRGPDWLYNYLRGFYADAKRPYGVNNVIFKDVGMPHVLAGLQGVCAEAPELGIEKEVDPLSGKIVKQSGCAKYSSEGSLSPADYDQAIYDLVNFLTYVGEPSRLQSVGLGRNVLIFLVLLFAVSYLLYKEYWRGIH